MTRLNPGVVSAAILLVVLLAGHWEKCMAQGGLLSPAVHSPVRLPLETEISLPESREHQTVPLELSVGWLEHPTGLVLSNNLPELLGGIVNNRRTSVKGVWSTLSLLAPLSDDVDVEFSASYLAARESDGLIESNIGLTADFEGAGLEWTEFQSLLHYDAESGLSWLAGIRVDRTSVRFHVIRPTSGNDDFIVWGYMPLIGLQLHQGSPKAKMSLRILGFPAAPGTIRFHTWSETSAYSQESNQDFSSGYYMEVQAQWQARAVLESLDAYVFGRWNLLHAKTSIEGALVPAPVRAIQWTVDRKSWTIGMGMSWNFDLR